MLRRFVADFRKSAVAIAALQLRQWFETGSIARSSGSKSQNFRIGSAPAQMAAALTAEGLKSFWSNRQNDFSSAVVHSQLAPELKTLLHQLNRNNKIFHGGSTVSPEVQLLAKAIFRALRKRHRLPNFAQIHPRIDQRCVRIEKPRQAKKFGLWLRFNLPKHGIIWLPLQDHGGRQKRRSRLCRTVQLVTAATGELSIRLFTDESCQAALDRAVYQAKCENLGLDFGLSAMFASSAGDLINRTWLAQLQRRDDYLSRMARTLKKNRIKPRQAKRYRRAVNKLRGYIRSEIGRALNRILELHSPKEIVIGRLNFQQPGLSTRLNRILQNCGLAVIRAWIEDKRQKIGLIVTEVNPYCSSQQCNRCHHVHRSNRHTQSQFYCCRCSYAIHADVGAARNIQSRRSWPESARLGGRRAALSLIAERFKKGVSGVSSKSPPDALPLVI